MALGLGAVGPRLPGSGERRGDSPVRDADHFERRRVAAMLARAFADDPAFCYIYPDPATRARLLPRLFALLYDSDGRAGLRLVSGGGRAVSLWRAPGRAAVGWGEMLLHALPLLAALRGATVRAMRVGDAIDAHQTAGAYWYLHILGCDPVHQGCGFGGEAVRAGLVRAGGLPCYRETATQANLGFYARLGFVVTGDWRVPRGGPRFWSMLRPAS